MSDPVITLLTDYGLADEFVGVCHGVIATHCPQARVLDVTHGVAACDVRAGALALERALPFLPVGVHMAVVDPGVGSARRAVVVAAANGRIFVGPDNGLLWPACVASGGATSAVDISASRFRIEPVSATFHGRDVFAPVAAELACGRLLAEVGEPIDPATLVRLEQLVAWIDGDTLHAEVIGVDGFGNAQLSAAARDAERLGLVLGKDFHLRLAGHELHVGRLVRTFADGREGELLLYVDPHGRLTLAIARDSAAARIGLAPGAAVELTGGDCELLP